MLNDYIAKLRQDRQDNDKEPVSSKTLKNHFICTNPDSI